MACTDCFRGPVKTDEPTGHVEEIHGLPTYVANPPDNLPAKGLVIIIPDGGGMPGVNDRLLADAYAQKGQFKVYLPDFMDGVVVPAWMHETFIRVSAISTIMDWITKPYHVACVIYGLVPFLIHNSFTSSMPKVKAFFSAVRQNEGTSARIGAVGICWGGQHTVHLAHGLKTDGENGVDLIDVAFTAHPASLQVPDDIKNVVKPWSIAIGDKDMLVPVKQVEQIEATLKTIDGLDSEVVYYPGAGHGFATRADPGNDKVMQQARDAEDQAVKWLTKYLSV